MPTNETAPAFPSEIHLMILEFVLGDKSLYERDYASPRGRVSRMSVSNWIWLSLVCGAWRNRVYKVAFQHLCVSRQRLIGLHGISATPTPDTKYLTTLRPTLGFIHTLTLYFPSRISSLPEVITILQDAPLLGNLAILINLQSDTPALCLPSETVSIPQVKCFSLRFDPTRLGFSLLWGAKDIQWILSCFPSVVHLLLDLPRHVCDSDIAQTPQYQLLPNIVSLSSTCWVDWLMGPQIDFPRLRFLDVCGDPSSDGAKFLDRNCNTIESICVSDVNHGWADLLPRFHLMRHVSLSYLYNFPWSLAEWPHLCHFEFLWLGQGEENSWPDISRFLDECPSLQAVTYHAPHKVSRLEDFCLRKSLICIWRKQSFHDSWRTSNVSWFLCYSNIGNKLVHLNLIIARELALRDSVHLMEGHCLLRFASASTG
jgi:hypothetical protein